MHGLYKRMINSFSFTGKRVGVNTLRSIYLNISDPLDKIDDHYLKILSKTEKQEIIKRNP